MFLCLINQSTRADVTDVWLDALVGDLNWQLQGQDKGGFCAEYGLAAWAVTRDQTVAGAVPCVISDTPDIPDAAGYHAVDALGHAYVKDFALGGLEDLAVTISHETLETVADLDADGFRLCRDGLLRAVEVCDPVEDQFYLGPSGLPVSNYVLPAWWGAGETGPYDKLAKLNAPFEYTPGGYVIAIKNGEYMTLPTSRRVAVAALPDYRRSAKRCRGR